MLGGRHRSGEEESASDVCGDEWEYVCFPSEGDVSLMKEMFPKISE
jgi:hypothetical protein